MPQQHSPSTPLLGTYHEYGHQGTEHGAAQHVGRVVLVVGDAAQGGVPAEHQADELQERPQQPCGAPRQSGLQVQLTGEDRVSRAARVAENGGDKWDRVRAAVSAGNVGEDRKYEWRRMEECFIGNRHVCG